MIASSPDMGPRKPDFLDVVVGGQTLTTVIKGLSAGTKLEFLFLRAGMPETQFTRQEAKTVVMALKEILDSHSTPYGSKNVVY